jgi:hypothetical protein
LTLITTLAVRFNNFAVFDLIGAQCQVDVQVARHTSILAFPEACSLLKNLNSMPPYHARVVQRGEVPGDDRKVLGSFRTVQDKRQILAGMDNLAIHSSHTLIKQLALQQFMDSRGIFGQLIKLVQLAKLVETHVQGMGFAVV